MLTKISANTNILGRINRQVMIVVNETLRQLERLVTHVMRGLQVLVGAIYSHTLCADRLASVGCLGGIFTTQPWQPGLSGDQPLGLLPEGSKGHRAGTGRSHAG